MQATAKKESRRLTAHPKLIYDVISMQAGTLAKAAQEAIQNSFDAGATRCEVRLDSRQFVITDNGKGFASEQEVNEYFAVFGTPHAETSGVRFGRFRMGRGQLFSFARTTYLTERFTMEVDIKNKGLDFEFTEHPETQVKGCEVTGVLYDPLPPSELHATLRDVKETVPYFPIPVFLNGEQINTLPTDEKWDVVTDDAYIKFKSSGGVRVYNYGVFVRAYHAEDLGLSAVVVSRKLLEVNFARNDILVNKCEVWKRVRKELAKHAEKKAKTTATLTDAGRALLIKTFLAGDLPYGEFVKSRVFRDAMQSHLSLNMILKAGLPISVAPNEFNRIADRLRETKQAIVLSPQTLEWFNVKSFPEVLAALTAAAKKEHESYSERYLNDWILAPLNALTYVPFEKLSAHFNDKVVLNDPKKLSARDMALFRAVTKTARQFHQTVVRPAFDDLKERSLKVGTYGDALAWTDGETYIAIGQRHMQRLMQGPSHAFELVLSLAHEYAHTSPDMGDTHTHDEEFHRRFYELTDRRGLAVGRCAYYLANQVVLELQRAGLKISRSVMLAADLEFRHEGLVSDEPVAADEEAETPSTRTVVSAPPISPLVA